MSAATGTDPQLPQPERAQSLARYLESRLSAPGAIDARGFEAFLDAQRRLGLTHGERALCRHLRPIVISRAVGFIALSATLSISPVVAGVIGRATTT